MRTVLALSLLVPSLALAQTTQPVAPTAPEPPTAPVPAVEPPPPTPPPAAPEVTVGVKYDKGFTFATSDDQFEMKAGIRNQLRLEVINSEADDEWESHFMIQRLRFQVEGHAFGKDTEYKVEFDFANKGSPILKDGFADHKFNAIHVRLGQWKKPFSRVELVSDFGSEMLERPITNDFAGAGRDIGVAVHNNYEKSPEIEWAAGIFNGTGEKPFATGVKCADPMDVTTCTVGTPTNVPVDFGPMLVLRLGYNSGGIKGYSEGDLEGGPLRFGVGVSYKVNFNDFADDAAQHAAEGDFIVKVQGFDVNGAVYFVKNGAADGTIGFHGQAGYFLSPKKMEVMARYAQIPLGTGKVLGDEQQMEILGGFAWYFGGHNFKWMIDGGALSTTGTGGPTDIRIRTQLQLVI